MNLDIEVLDPLEAPDLTTGQGVAVVGGSFVAGAVLGYLGYIAITAIIAT